MIGALICGYIGYKLGKSNERKQQQLDDASLRFYRDQLHAMTQIAAIRAAAGLPITINSQNIQQ